MIDLANPPPCGTESILLVDDNPGVREATMRILRSLGYQVIEAEDGAHALALLEGDTPVDLLFTDMVMPGGICGVDLVEKALKLRPLLAALFMSGYAGETDAKPLAMARKHGVLRKPYRRQELALRLRNALDERGGPEIG